jgi:hypothetical protein
VSWNLAHAETLPPRHAGSWEHQYNGLGFGFVPKKEKRQFAFVDSERKQSKARTCGPTVSRSIFQKLINIDQRLQRSREHDGSITLPRWRLPVTESFALPPVPRWNAMTDYPAAIPLLAILDAAVKRSTIILTNSDGAPWTADGFRASWSKACAKAGVVGVTFNDLRGTAVTRLAMAGCTGPRSPPSPDTRCAVYARSSIRTI